MAKWSGWIAVALIAVAFSVPIGQRLLTGKRAAPTSAPTRGHVAIGLVVATLAFLHTLVAIVALGSPSAVAVGDLALAAGGLAFLALTAHTGLGLQLRRPKLPDRVAKRRSHTLTALLICAAVGVHSYLLYGAR
ncbi:MAG: hypothetical protein R3B72_36830 [Polyangiaceae bacterium]